MPMVVYLIGHYKVPDCWFLHNNFFFVMGVLYESEVRLCLLQRYNLLLLYVDGLGALHEWLTKGSQLVLSNPEVIL